MTALGRVGQDTFGEKVTCASGPVVVMFSKPGCPACQNVYPRMQRLAEMYAGRVPVLLCDVVSNPVLARYAPDGFPRVTVYAEGAEVWHRTGGNTSEKMVSMWVDEALSGGG